MLTIGLPGCTYVKSVTLHDTTDNIKDAVWLQNVGTAGLVMIRQGGGYGNEDIYLTQGQAISVLKYWHGAMLTGTGAGVALRAFR
jgi:hypothetical protein